MVITNKLAVIDRQIPSPHPQNARTRCKAFATVLSRKTIFAFSVPKAVETSETDQHSADIPLPPRFLRAGSRRVAPKHRVAYAWLFSLVVHASLLSLTFTGQGFGLLGFSALWRDRRVDASALQVFLAPKPVEPTEPVALATPVTDAAPKPAPVVARIEKKPEPETKAEAETSPAPEPKGAAKSSVKHQPAPENTSTLKLDKALAISVPLPAPPAPPAAADAPPILAVERTLNPAFVTPAASPAPAPEPLSNDTAAQEAAKLEAARVQAAKLEAEQKEAARVELAKQEALREEAARVESAKIAALRAETAKQESARLEATRNEAARREAAAVELAKQEAAQRAEATRLEAARVEVAKLAVLATQRAEAAKQEAAKQEAARADAAKLAADKEEEARREARRQAMGRQLNEEAARRDAVQRGPNADSTKQLPYSYGSIRRARLWGRTDPNTELVNYAEAWARKIQFNTPVDAVQNIAKQKYTNPMVTVALRSDGSVESITFVASSGVADIDEAIRRMVHRQANYPAFPSALARDYDVVEIRRTWHFDSAVRIY